MRGLSVAVCAVLILVASLGGPLLRVATAQEAVYLVRHAERLDDAKDSLLSAEGRARAAHLAEMLRDTGITHIFVSEYRRTAETAAPVAARLGITVQKIPADRPDALLARVRAAGPKARILIAGHSDTVPALLKALGCTQQVTIAKAEYDNLFVVIPGDKAGPVLVRLRY
jgi:broad specificity phosphatase PhoE